MTQTTSFERAKINSRLRWELYAKIGRRLRWESCLLSPFIPRYVLQHVSLTSRSWILKILRLKSLRMQSITNFFNNQTTHLFDTRAYFFVNVLVRHLLFAIRVPKEYRIPSHQRRVDLISARRYDVGPGSCAQAATVQCPHWTTFFTGTPTSLLSLSILLH